MNLQSKPEPREFGAQPSPFPSKAGDWRLEEDKPGLKRGSTQWEWTGQGWGAGRSNPDRNLMGREGDWQDTKGKQK